MGASCWLLDRAQQNDARQPTCLPLPKIQATRLTMVLAEWVLAQYGQFDGYPEGQGIKVVRFLSVAQNIQKSQGGLAAYLSRQLS